MKQQDKVLTMAIWQQVMGLLEKYPENTEVSPQRMYYWRSQVAKDLLSPTLAARILEAYGVKPHGAILLPIDTALKLVRFIESSPFEVVENIIECNETLKSLL